MKPNRLGEIRKFRIAALDQNRYDESTNSLKPLRRKVSQSYWLLLLTKRQPTKNLPPLSDDTKNTYRTDNNNNKYDHHQNVTQYNLFTH